MGWISASGSWKQKVDARGGRRCDGARRAETTKVELIYNGRPQPCCSPRGKWWPQGHRPSVGRGHIGFRPPRDATRGTGDEIAMRCERRDAAVKGRVIQVRANASMEACLMRSTVVAIVERSTHEAPCTRRIGRGGPV